MESPEQTEPDRLEGLVRVSELEDEISALARKHRQLRVGFLAALVMVIGVAIGALRDPSVWELIVLGMLVSSPWTIRAGRAQGLAITKRKEDLLLKLEEAKQPGRLHAPDDATVEPRPQDGSDAITGV